MKRVVTGLFLLLASLGGASTARAELVVGADSSVSKPLDQDAVNTGFALRGNVGYEVAADTPGIHVTPGVAFEYGHYDVDGLPEAATNMLALGGVRAAYGEVVQPSLSMELGYGQRHVLVDRGPIGRFEGHKRGLVIGLGGALDFALTSAVSLGVHVRYRRLNGDVELSISGKTITAGADPLAWIDTGAHVAMRF